MRQSYGRGGNEGMRSGHRGHGSASMLLRLPDKRKCRTKKENQESASHDCYPGKGPELRFILLDAVARFNVSFNPRPRPPRPTGLPRHPGLCYNQKAVKHTGQQEIALAAAKGVMVGESGPSAQPASGTSAHRQEDASRYCPVCSQRLESRRCKLVCNVCGYYMSCADYY
jgi:hypothetical protein